MLYGRLPSIRRSVRPMMASAVSATLAVMAPAVEATTPPVPAQLLVSLARLDGTPVTGVPVQLQTRSVARKGLLVTHTTVAEGITDATGRCVIAATFAAGALAPLAVRALYAGGGPEQGRPSRAPSRSNPSRWPSRLQLVRPGRQELRLAAGQSHARIGRHEQRRRRPALRHARQSASSASSIQASGRSPPWRSMASSFQCASSGRPRGRSAGTPSHRADRAGGGGDRWPALPSRWPRRARNARRGRAGERPPWPKGSAVCPRSSAICPPGGALAARLRPRRARSRRRCPPSAGGSRQRSARRPRGRPDIPQLGIFCCSRGFFRLHRGRDGYGPRAVDPPTSIEAE